MDRNDTPEPDVHPVALLLPWYLTGTLGVAERGQADEHLASCTQCRSELAELQMIRSQVLEASGGQAVSLDTLRVTKARIRPSRDESSSGLSGVAAMMRALFRPSWAPAAALALILVQSGVVVWMAQRVPVAPEVATRGLAAPATRIRLALQPTASEQDLRQLLLAIHAQIVAGPTTDGVYVVTVQTTDPSHVEQKLAALRAQPGLVRLAEREAP